MSSFKRNGDRVTEATVQYTGGAWPTDGPGYAFLTGKAQTNLMATASDIVLVKLRGDFVIDLNLQGKALDAEFTRAQFPTGNGPQGTALGLQGGLFESWFGLRSGDPPPAGAQGLMVPLNTATAFDLVRVPGISMERAEAIVAARDRRRGKRFRNMDQLKSAGGFDDRLMAIIKPHIKIE